MEKYYYTKQDIMEITGYGSSKASEIIKELNTQLKELYEEKNKPIYIVKKGVPIWFFKQITGIERSE